MNLKCTYCLRDKHYEEFRKAGWGRPAPDGTKRHQNCKVCQKYKSRLSNAVRYWLPCGKCISPNSKDHPYHEDYVKGGYEAVFAAMGLVMPIFDPDDVSSGTLASNTCNEWLDYLAVPNENREVRIGPYQVDALWNGIILEFYGTFYHADPRFYAADDQIFKRSAEEIWLKDQKREEYLSQRHPMLIVWEHDWRNYANKLTNSIAGKVVLSNNESLDLEKSGHFILKWLVA